MRDTLNHYTQHIHEHGAEKPEMRDWKRPENKA